MSGGNHNHSLQNIPTPSLATDGCQNTGVTHAKMVGTSSSIILMIGQAVDRLLEDQWTSPSSLTPYKTPEHEIVSGTSFRGRPSQNDRD